MGIRHGTIGSQGDRRDERQVIMLAATVERLRTEVEQLRATLRTSAVVEQAKGILAERFACGVDAAYEHLLELARDNNVSQVAAAALLLGLSLPPDAERDAPSGSALFNPDSYLRESAAPSAVRESAGPSARRESAGPSAVRESAGPSARRESAGPSAVRESAGNGVSSRGEGAGSGTGVRPLGESAGNGVSSRGEGAGAGTGVPPPRAADRRDARRAARRRRELAEPAAHRHLATATFASARTADELAARLCTDALGWLGARGVLLAATEPDGALTMVGAHGVPPHVVSGWSRIPPGLDLGLVRAASTGSPVWPERTIGLAAPGAQAGRGGVRVCAPMVVADRVIGAAEVIWPDGTTLDEEQRRYVTAVTLACGRRLQELLGDGRFTPGRRTPWLRAVIDAVPGPAALMSPVRDPAGRVIDFRIEACNTETTDALGRDSDDLTGTRLVTMYPGLALSGLFDAYVGVLETGTPLRIAPKEYATLLDGRVLPSMMSVRACRIGDGVLVSWRFHNDSDDLAAQLGQAQRLGNLGWAGWDLSTGETRWSDQLYVIFGQDQADGPVGLDELAGRVLPEDLPVAEHLVRTLFDRREPIDTVVRIRRGEETRRLRLMGEPILDPLGEPTELRCVVQDVTGPYQAEQDLAASRAEIERQRGRIAEEQNIALELQRSVLPLPGGTVRKPGLRTAVRYLPAGSSARVGGDWYETTAIDGGGVFVAIGDVSGHGLTAAAAMARLRNALSGLAFTAASPDRLLGWLNQVVLHWPGTLTATVLAGRFDPAARVLTWAQAGHLPPILIRAGKALELATPDGILLGATPEPEFATMRTELQPDDLLLFYTDGLIERRDRDLREGLDLLVEAAARERSTDPERILDRVLEAFDAPNPNDDTCVLALRIE
jgi:serine phosphatase RsbU (regulator of sigma subunit)